MEYYIEPAEQTEEVNQQLKDITPESIDPETIKVLDPASGSGHILIEAYNVLKAIYEERGYRSREIPKLILEKNIYGLDIDDRAAQLSGFSLMMMARQDDRRIFSRDVRLNVLSLQETEHLDLPKLWQDLNLSGDWTSGATQDMFGGDLDLSSFEADNRYQLLQRNIERFKQAKTFGSLIEVPAAEYEALKELHDTVLELLESGDSIQRAAASQIIDVVHQALLLAIRYDAVVANPPYMGRKYMNPVLRDYLSQHFKEGESDLYAAFVVRLLNMVCPRGFVSLMTPFTWMNLSSYEALRVKILEKYSLQSLVQPQYHSFFETANVPLCLFAIQTIKRPWNASFIDLSSFHGKNNQAPNLLTAIKEKKCSWMYERSTHDFLHLPKKSIAYWIDENVQAIFDRYKNLRENGIIPATGLQTGDNKAFIRDWDEVSIISINKKWFPLNKGGDNRRWYGNFRSVILWENDGEEIKAHPSSVIRNPKLYFLEGATWNRIGSSFFSIRYLPKGYIFDQAGDSLFCDNPDDLYVVIGLINSSIGTQILQVLCPTLNATAGSLEKFPFIELPSDLRIELINNVQKIISISKEDWDQKIYSMDFRNNPLIKLSIKTERISEAYQKYTDHINEEVKLYKHLQNENEKILHHFLSMDIAEEADLPVTLYWNEINLNRGLFHSQSIVDLISYSVGCMMGRYSLDQEGLVYAHAGNEDFDTSLYQTFAADSDGIIPITDEEWFKDDVSNRVVEFIKTVWGEENLTENLKFIADSLCLDAIKPKNSESAAATIRRYLSTQFYKDHMQTYKNRPIYWLFSSGKEKAFECLVYLHRYNESTLSRMRTEYVTPLLGKYEAYAEQLDKQIEMAESTQDKKRLERELKSMDKKQSELREFDDKLKHFADMRISIDLDDGVKENYGKFSDLLAEVKKITGEKPEIINAN